MNATSWRSLSSSQIRVSGLLKPKVVSLRPELSTYTTYWVNTMTVCYHGILVKTVVISSLLLAGCNDHVSVTTDKVDIHVNVTLECKYGRLPTKPNSE